MLFNKTRKKLKAIEEDIKNNFVPRNIYEMEQRINAMDNLILASNNSNNDDEYTIDDIEWNDWIILNNWADYFANRFKYESENFEDNFIINYVLRVGYLFGRVGVYNFNGTKAICYIVSKDEEGTYEILVLPESGKELEAIYNTMEGAQNWKTIKKVSADNIVFYQFDSLGLPAIAKLKPVIILEKLSQRAICNDMRMLPTRLIQTGNGGAISKKITKIFLWLRKPLLYKQEGGTDTFTSIKINSQSDILINFIEFAKGYYYNILGRRNNTDLKKAQYLETEITQIVNNLEAIERDRYMYLKGFLRKYSERFNVKIFIEDFNTKLINVNEQLGISVDEEIVEKEEENIEE